MDYEPMISQELFELAVLSFVLGLVVYAVLGAIHIYLMPRAIKWFKGLFYLESQKDELPALPKWDFGPAISHVRIIEDSIAPTTNKPYDWALEEDGYYN
tara:strand:+ start:1562 stop:1858 length:297 start_codon:yes stop_codon:yes gene_type:complete